MPTNPLPAAGILLANSCSALGDSAQSMRVCLSHSRSALMKRTDLFINGEVYVGQYQGELPMSVPTVLADAESRNLRLALAALAPIEAELIQRTADTARVRLAIVVGTSTSGISDNEVVLAEQLQQGRSPSLNYARQTMSATAQAIKQYLGWQGPCYTVSTACSSSAKALACGQRLLAADVADYVLVGGVDSLARLTVNGFASLESISASICTPCGDKRDGINIGEAAVWFLLGREQADVNVISSGESMDGWHISAPHPEGDGARLAMQRALTAANLAPASIDYLNLHGTGTAQNDAMEIKAVRRLFENNLPLLSSTKHQTGHCLGAAGALEAHIAMCVLTDQHWLPLHSSTEIDPELSDMPYVRTANHNRALRYVMSNSFAFGGSNISLILGKAP